MWLRKTTSTNTIATPPFKYGVFHNYEMNTASFINGTGFVPHFSTWKITDWFHFHYNHCSQEDTYSRTLLLNSFCRLPRYSPMSCLLRPLRVIRNLATVLGLSSINRFSIRYLIPFSGFLQITKHN